MARKYGWHQYALKEACTAPLMIESAFCTCAGRSRSLPCNCTGNQCVTCPGWREYWTAQAAQVIEFVTLGTARNNGHTWQPCADNTLAKKALMVWSSDPALRRPCQ